MRKVHPQRGVKRSTPPTNSWNARARLASKSGKEGEGGGGAMVGGDGRV